MTKEPHIIVVGGGIVGLATAYRLTQTRADCRVTVLEKEGGIALHQTGRNSGVIHSGIYYKPGSAKAVNCREGRARLLEFCQEFEVPYELCGKVIVAVEPGELARLQALWERGRANGVDCRMIGAEELKELEPHAAGLQALHVPEAGIVDYGKVCQVLRGQIRGEVVTGVKVGRILVEGDNLVTETDRGDFRGDILINCAGLHSDRVCRMAGGVPPVKIVPFKGEYFSLRASAGHLCRNLIYPVPDPAFPFLGVHLTRMISGGVEVGPNAVLALGREAYEKADVNLRDLMETLSYPGFLRLGLRHWRMGLGEMWRCVSKKAFVRALNRLCPALEESHLLPTTSGIRAQALHPNGELEDDFRILKLERSIHVLNAPSPAATACLAIGEVVSREVWL